MEKFTLAGNAAQKEKYEAELKKTIKKLQRERDQIKAWLTQNEIKDKTVLTDTRKLIEQKMEAFKAVERELKTKAYSREGLSAATKMDPQEKEKADLGAWITESVDRLSAQVDKYEAKAEVLQASAKKSKKSDAGKLEKLTQLEKQVERHKGHMSNLEIILRMLENGNLSVEEVGFFGRNFLATLENQQEILLPQVQSIKEDVDYYIESAEGGDFPEDDTFYEDLNLDEAEFAHAGEDGSDTEEDEGAPSPKETERPGSGPTSAVGSPQQKEEKKPLPAREFRAGENRFDHLTKTFLAVVAAPVAKPIVAAVPAKPVVAPPAAKPAAQPVVAGLPPRQPFTAAVRAPAVVPAPPPVVSTAGRGYSAVAAATAAATPTPDSANGPGFADDKKVPVRTSSGDAKAPGPIPATPAVPAVRPPGVPPTSPLPPPPGVPQTAAQIAAQGVSIPAPQPPLAPTPQPVPPQVVTSPTPSSTVSQASMSPQLSSARPASSSPLPQTPTAGPSSARPSEGGKEEQPQQPQEGAENRLPPSLADLVESFEAAKARCMCLDKERTAAAFDFDLCFGFCSDKRYPGHELFQGYARKLVPVHSG
jgi:CCR4-NOT transcription complex subunit 3